MSVYKLWYKFINKSIWIKNIFFLKLTSEVRTITFKKKDCAKKKNFDSPNSLENSIEKQSKL